MFLAKYAPGGEAIWVKRAGSITASTRGYSLDVDASGSIYVAGGYQYDADFDGTVLSNEGNYDIFIVRYDSNGNMDWVKSIGDTAKDRAFGIELDGSGHFYIAGEFSETVDFASGIDIESEGGTDIFLAKFDLSGNCIWAVQAGDTADDGATSLALDQSGNIVMTGSFQYHPDFQGTSIHSSGNEDMFIASYDDQGNLNWVKKGGGVENDIGRSVDTDPFGNIYVMGDFADVVTFSGTSRTSNGFADFFVASYTPSGSLRFAKSGGGVSNDRGNDVAVRNTDEIFLIGDYKETMTLNSISVNSVLLSDIYVTYLVNAPSGINDPENKLNIAVHPDPVVNRSIIKLPENNQENIHMIIYDIRGNIISEKKDLSAEIELVNNNLNEGIYFFQIFSNSKSYTGNFTVINN
jgi:hypothetical protein